MIFVSMWEELWGSWASQAHLALLGEPEKRRVGLRALQADPVLHGPPGQQQVGSWASQADRGWHGSPPADEAIAAARPSSAVRGRRRYSDTEQITRPFHNHRAIWCQSGQLYSTGNICVICLSIPFLPRLLGVIICVLVCSKNENFSSFLVILCKLGRVGW